jgi:hypothetical protein
MNYISNIGNGTTPWDFPLYTFYDDSRTQVIYLASEISRAGFITSLAIDVNVVPGQVMKNWTIRMKHTTLNTYSSCAMESTGWTTVYQSDELIDATGWKTFALSRIFYYDGISNLMVDFSHNNTSNTNSGSCRSSIPGGSRSVIAYSDSLYGSPLNWAGTTSPSTGCRTNVPNIRLNQDDAIKHDDVLLTINVFADPQAEVQVVSTVKGSTSIVVQQSSSSSANGSIWIPYATDIPIDINLLLDQNIDPLIDDGYHVSKIEGTQGFDGESVSDRDFLPTSVIVNTIEETAHTLNIWVEPNGIPTFKNITTVKNGHGNITPSGGSYIDYPATIISFTATPSFGSKFLSWDISPSLEQRTENSIRGNIVTILANRDYTVTANFNNMTDEELQTATSKSFYCRSKSSSQNLIEFDYTNATALDQRLHFRATFYNDIYKTSAISSPFSLYDQKRWFIKNSDSSLTPFPIDGYSVSATGTETDTVTIQYVPDILPIEYLEQQHQSIINPLEISSGNLIAETPLVCGVPYFVHIQTYDTNNTFSEISFSPVTIKCSNLDINSWRDNKDSKNWLCSGQGRIDLKISNSGSQSINSSVSANTYGMFVIAWQSRRNNLNPIYSATWDSEKDILYSSGQGLQEHKLINTGFKPQLLTDVAQNIYASAHTTNQILQNKCGFPKEKQSTIITDDAFSYKCYPGYQLDASLVDLKMRVFEEDIVGSLIINENKIASVVDKQNIRFDITGIHGSYAVRFRNASDKEWTDWINIDTDLYVSSSSSNSSDVKFDAYSIDTDRFIAPFELPKTNGVRRICCQVLTPYGISKTISLDIFVNMSMVEYNILFYTAYDINSGFSKPVAIFNGHPIISGNDSIVYIRVIFNTSQNDGLKFNVIQEGIADIYGSNLSLIENTGGLEFVGSFPVNKHDGLFNKDGLGFISIIFSDETTNTISSCESDFSDQYNLMVNGDDIVKYQDESAETVSKSYQTSRISKLLQINDFVQQYNKDDENLMFGNPKFYIKQ